LNGSQLTFEEGAYLNLGSNVAFKGDSIDDSGILELNSASTTCFEEANFKYCNLINKNGLLIISNSDFKGCNISSNDGFLRINDTELDGEHWTYNTYGILSNNDWGFELDNVIVENYNQGIRLNYTSVFTIDNTIIRNNYTQGLYVYNSRHSRNYIYNSQFTGSLVSGVQIYGSNVKITSCNITQNGRGISIFNRSNVTLEKAPDTDPWILDSKVSSNINEEILFFEDCQLHLADNRNKIFDNTYIAGTPDEFLIRCPNLITGRSFNYNYWGYIGANGSAILPPENRFYPVNTFHLSPVYDPGIPRGNEKTDDQIFYETAVIEAENGNPFQSEILLKNLIAEFPESEYKQSSASFLLSIQEDDFQSLKTYFENEPNLHSDDLIELYTGYLQTYCDIKSENYQEAIEWYESVITNPPSLVDSVCAVIDLGDLYLQIEENGRGIVGKYTNLIPRSKKEFEQTKKDLFDLLDEEYEYEPETEPGDCGNSNLISLNKNYPNPFNPTTTISFSIPNESIVELSIFNLKGQKIKTLVNKKLDIGEHSLLWNGVDESEESVSSGVYFYKLAVDGKTRAVKKCLMLK